jgi:hypothetical protein
MLATASRLRLSPHEHRLVTSKATKTAGSPRGYSLSVMSWATPPVYFNVGNDDMSTLRHISVGFGFVEVRPAPVTTAILAPRQDKILQLRGQRGRRSILGQRVQNGEDCHREIAETTCHGHHSMDGMSWSKSGYTSIPHLPSRPTRNGRSAVGILRVFAAHNPHPEL